MKRKGFTLIELATVLAIISILAAVLTPVVVNYMDQARTTRAVADVRSIADAVRLYQRDTGKFPIYANTTDAGSDTAGASLLVGPGTAPTDGSTSPTNQWTTGITTTTLEVYLNENKLNLTTTPKVGNTGFKGPYIGTVQADPWGYRYTVTAMNLTRASTNWGVVISPGPDGILQTDPTQVTSAQFTALGDDIVAIVK